jgi:hypothetical protein
MAEFPRPLTERETEILLMLLPEGAFPDVETYRAQVPHTEAVAPCSCGCPSVTLRVDDTRAERAAFRGAPLLPVQAVSSGGPTDDLAQLILFAPGGWLEDLELVYYTVEPPTEIAPPERWRLVGPQTD